jgi:hypothetical protein
LCVGLPAKAQTSNGAKFAPPTMSSAAAYRQGLIPQTVQSRESYWNSAGALGIYLPNGAISTTTHPFFLPFGTSGRACVTCHQPPSGMSISLRNVRSRFNATRGADPLFASIDGTNCPNALNRANAANPGGAGSLVNKRAASSVLLNRGLIRIVYPWPPRDATGTPIAPEFALSITPATDLPGCNADPLYGVAAGFASVYRRPPPTAQMNLKTARFTSTGPTLPGSLMWDGRAASLEQQAIDAIRVHARPLQDPTPEQVAKIVDFQVNLFVAQTVDREAGRLDANGAAGGPVNLRSQLPVTNGGFPFTEFNGWNRAAGKAASIARGQAIFNGLTFNISNVDGFNDLPNTPRIGTCSSCHNIKGLGADIDAPPRLSIGIGGSSVIFGGLPAADDLPIFTLTCRPGTVPGFQGPGPIETNDPGLALLTGRCADIGKFTVPQLRSLAAREPYFHDGSSGTLQEVLDFYMGRFAIPLSRQQQDDLINFLQAL